MSRLDELIAELCPNGVEYLPLSEIATITRGGSLQKKDFTESGIPCIHYGQIYTKFGLFTDKTFTFISEATALRQKKAVTGDIVMAVTSENIEDVCKCVVWLGDEDVAVSGHIAIIHHNQDAKYLAYYFHSSMFFAQKVKLAHGTKVIEVTPDKLNGVRVPVPPLEAQREIVRVLDNYTSLSAELSMKLSMELSARRKQYEYYKESLFEKYCSANTTFVPLSTIADVRDGTHDSPKPASEGKYLITSKNVKNGSITFEGSYLISNEDYDAINMRSKVDKWDLLFTMIGTVGEVGLISDDPDFAIKNVGLIKTGDEAKARFLKHYLTSGFTRRYVEENRSKGTQVFLALGKLRSIPVPDLSEVEQSAIVEVLDRFDRLISDLSSGLPGEIEARNKQYEYYRDKLLTFKEL